MTTTAISNAVSDAAAGLPSGWTQYVTDNIGTAAGQQAILAAAANYGITDPSTIASLVNQATGMNVTAAQVQAVAAPAPAPTPAPAASSGTPLSNIAAPQFVGTSAPGAVGTTYGQASGDMISAAQQANPALSQALVSGNAAVNYNADTGTYNLIDKTTGAPIAGNYQVQVGPNGTGINIPSGNGMIQVTAQTDQSGTIAPVTAANVQNVGLNQGAGGFAGGPDAFMAVAGPAISVAFPEVAPFISAYNSASAANKGQYGLALVNALGAAGIYAAQNPTSQIGQMVNGAIDAVKSSLPQSIQDLISTPSSTSAPTTSTTNAPSTPQIGDTTGLGNTNTSAPTTPTTPSAGTNLGDLTNAQQLPESVLNPNFVNTPQAGDLTNLSSLGTGTASLPLTNTPIPFSNMVGVAPTSTSVSSTAPVTPNATTPIVNNIGLPNTTPVNTTTGLTPSTAITPSAAAPAAAAAAAAPAAAAGLTTAQAAALGIPAAAAIIGTGLTNKAISNAASTQAAAGANAQDLIHGLYTAQSQIQAPYQQLGNQAVNTLGSLGSGTYNTLNPDGTVASTGTGSGYLTNQFNNTDLNAQLAPNYAFQLQQGQGQAQNAANVGGGLLSGNTLQGLNTYTQNYAQGAYQNAFTNYQNQRNNIYNTLAGQAGIGQTANQQLSSLGGQLANTYGNVTTGLAATQAGATTAQAVNNANLLSNLANTATVVALS